MLGTTILNKDFDGTHTHKKKIGMKYILTYKSKNL